MADFGRTKVVYDIETAVDLLGFLEGLEPDIIQAAEKTLKPPRWRDLVLRYSPRVHELLPGVFQIWPKLSIRARAAPFDIRRADDLDLLSDEIETIMDDALDIVGAVVREKKVQGQNRPDRETVYG